MSITCVSRYLNGLCSDLLPFTVVIGLHLPIDGGCVASVHLLQPADGDKPPSSHLDPAGSGIDSDKRYCTVQFV